MADNEKHITVTERNNWNSKAPAVHAHTIGDVTGMQTALDSKINSSMVNVPNGVAGLDGNGKMNFSLMPFSLVPIASPITDAYNSTLQAITPQDTWSPDRVRWVANLPGTVRVMWNGRTNATGNSQVGTRILKNGTVWDERYYQLVQLSGQFVYDIPVVPGDTISIQMKLNISNTILLGVENAYIGATLVKFERTV